jgi:phosphoglycerol transferase MdoB-like AlkP superfamily enzyme
MHLKNDERREANPIWLVLGLVFGPGLFMFFLARLWFLALNFSALKSLPIFSALVMGVRFDLALLSLVNSPLLLIGIAFWWFKRSSRSLIYLFLLVNLPLLWADLGDALYFRFTGRRSTFATFQFFSDALDQAAQITGHFFYVGLGLAVFTYLVIKLSFALAKKIDSLKLGKGLWVASLGFLVFVFLARGGYQEKPLTPAHAYGAEGSNWAALALNTGFTALKSKHKEIEASSYMPDSEVKQILEAARTPVSLKSYPGQNVVVLLVESLSLEVMNQPTDVTPFLNGLKEKSLFFENAFANGRRSIDAVPSILGSLPALMNEPFINTDYRANHVRGLPNILAEQGYKSIFFHGGRNGTMFFDVMSAMFGVQSYFGKSEYGRGDDDEAWGVFDGPFLQRVVVELSRAAAPFFSVVFTLSSHNPYKLPESYVYSGPESTSPYLKSISYVDQALKDFFISAAKEPWFENTLFMITGDHTGESMDVRFQSELGSYRVPMILYSPSGNIKPRKSTKLVQHADISASVMDYLGLLNTSTPPTLIGQSMLSESSSGYVVLKSGEEFILGLGDKMYALLPKGDLQVKSLPPDFYSGLEPSNLDGANLIKALKQYFEKGMTENKLSPEAWH